MFDDAMLDDHPRQPPSEARLLAMARQLDRTIGEADGLELRRELEGSAMRLPRPAAIRLTQIWVDLMRQGRPA